MVFKNEKELKEFVLKKSRNALAKTQEKVYKILDRFLNDFYKDYTPGTYTDWDGTQKFYHGYDRTYQLLRSLVKADVVPSKNGYKAEVYFDKSYLDSKYDTGNQPSGMQVMEAAAQGLHGAIGDNLQYVHGNTGVSVWNDPIKILDAKAIEMLKDMLIAEGIPIK